MSKQISERINEYISLKQGNKAMGSSPTVNVINLIRHNNKLLKQVKGFKMGKGDDLDLSGEVQMAVYNHFGYFKISNHVSNDAVTKSLINDLENADWEEITHSLRRK